MENSYPSISVILPVYNGEKYLHEALTSILEQTFENFELIVIDDGSKDNSAAIVTNLKDSRIRLFQQENQGLAATLNRGISLARADLIARQDQDDVSYPERLAKQFGFMETNPNLALLGTWADILEEDRSTERVLVHPTGAAALKFSLCFDNYMVHSSVMMRRAAVVGVGGYSTDRSRQPPEDYELWSRIMKRYDIDNLPERLIAYREVASSMSRKGVSPFQKNIEKISIENLEWACRGLYDSDACKAFVNLKQGNNVQLPGGMSLKFFRKLLNEIAGNLRQENQGDVFYLNRELRRRKNEITVKWLNYKTGGLLRRLRQFGSRI